MTDATQADTSEDRVHVGALRGDLWPLLTEAMVELDPTLHPAVVEALETLRYFKRDEDGDYTIRDSDLELIRRFSAIVEREMGIALGGVGVLNITQTFTPGGAAASIVAVLFQTMRYYRRRGVQLDVCQGLTLRALRAMDPEGVGIPELAKAMRLPKPMTKEALESLRSVPRDGGEPIALVRRDEELNRWQALEVTPTPH